jgi:ribosomal protein S18 acetylase RimI-like enzyme
MAEFDAGPLQGERAPLGQERSDWGAHFVVRALQAADLAGYKRLRDTVLAADPQAFTSDATEESRKSAQSYLPRLGLDRPEGGQFTLGAWQAEQLVGAVTCEREPRIKGRHIGHVAGMMVLDAFRGQGVGRSLLAACIARAKATPGMELLTLTVTATNRIAVDMYLRAGFTRYGTLVHAIKLGNAYHDKDLMVLNL